MDVNTPEADGTTALHWAVDGDHPELVELLLHAGASVKAANRYGVTPLWLACANGSAATVVLLLKAGADPNTALPEGETVLMTAARTGRLDAVKALVEAGAAVNAREGWHGQTALMWAAAEGYPAVIQTLVEGGADLHVRSNGGFTALLFAAREGQIGAVRTLLGAGADSERFPPGAGTPASRRHNAQRSAPPRPKSASTRSCSPPRTHTTSSLGYSWIGRRSQRGPSRVDGAASGVVGAQGRHFREQ